MLRRRRQGPIQILTKTPVVTQAAGTAIPLTGSGAEGDFNVVVVQVDDKAASAVRPIMRAVSGRAIIGATVFQGQPDRHTRVAGFSARPCRSSCTALDDRALVMRLYTSASRVCQQALNAFNL